MHPLRAFREQHKLTQRQLAELLDEKIPTVSRWETGTRKIGPDKLPVISEKTGIPAAELRPDLAQLLGGDQ